MLRLILSHHDASTCRSSRLWRDGRVLRGQRHSLNRGLDSNQPPRRGACPGFSANFCSPACTDNGVWHRNDRLRRALAAMLAPDAEPVEEGNATGGVQAAAIAVIGIFYLASGLQQFLAEHLAS